MTPFHWWPIFGYRSALESAFAFSDAYERYAAALVADGLVPPSRDVVLEHSRRTYMSALQAVEALHDRHRLMVVMSSTAELQRWLDDLGEGA